MPIDKHYTTRSSYLNKELVNGERESYSAERVLRACCRDLVFDLPIDVLIRLFEFKITDPYGIVGDDVPEGTEFVRDNEPFCITARSVKYMVRLRDDFLN